MNYPGLLVSRTLLRVTDPRSKKRWMARDVHMAGLAVPASRRLQTWTPQPNARGII
jgi:hypothetical protein